MQNIDSELRQLQLNLSRAQQEKLFKYLELLNKWNKAINLSAIRDIPKMLTHHIYDSLSIVPYINGQHILDIGSGGGLPGVPVAICKNNCQVTLLDSRSKKTNFLEHAKLQLHLDNVNVVQMRLSEFVAETLFDVIVVRAVGPIEELLPDCERLANKNARLIYMTGVAPKSLPPNSELVKLDVPGLLAERHLIIVKLKSK